MNQQEKIKAIEKAIRTVTRLLKAKPDEDGDKEITVINLSTGRKATVHTNAGFCHLFSIISDIDLYHGDNFLNILPELYSTCKKMRAHMYAGYFWATNTSGWEKRLQALKTTLKSMKHGK